MTNSPHRWITSALLAVCTTASVLTVSGGPAWAVAALGPSRAATATTAAVVVRGPVNVRVGPSTGTPVVGRLPDGARVRVSCRTSGQRIHGPVRTTSYWDRLTNGRYVSHAYLRTATLPPPCTPDATVDPTGGPNGTMDHTAFIAASVAPAQRSQREFAVPASVTIAQAILESGWGRSKLTSNDRNFFGIKCFSGDTGPIAIGCHSYATSECEPVCRPTTASFRVYSSATDSFRDHGRFLTVNSRYRPAFAYTHDADQFLFQIWKAGYATSPTYVTNVQALMGQYNLYRYDLPAVATHR